jgi:hypothetical protein
MLVATQATSSVSVEYYTTCIAVRASTRGLRVQDVRASFTIVAAATAVAGQLALLLASINATEFYCAGWAAAAPTCAGSTFLLVIFS